MSARIGFNVVNNLKLYPREAVVAELDKQIAESSHLLAPDKIKNSILSAREWSDDNLARMFSLLDSMHVAESTEGGQSGFAEVCGVTEKDYDYALRILTQLRNYNCHFAVPDIIEFVENGSKPLSIRVAALEVLAWFNLSYRNHEIVALCRRLLDESSLQVPQRLREEAHRTLLRMGAYQN